MRIPVLLLVLLVLAFCASVVSQDTSNDEAAIRDLAEKYMEGWNKGDAKACADVYTPDADMIDLTGETFKGRDEIEKGIAASIANAKGARNEITITSVRFVKPDLAVVDGTWELTGGSGDTAAPAKGLYTVIAVKEDGQWFVAADRNRVPAEPITKP